MFPLQEKCPGVPLRRGYGVRDARAESRSQHLPLEELKERIPLAVRQIHSFLKAHQPA